MAFCSRCSKAIPDEEAPPRLCTACHAGAEAGQHAPVEPPRSVPEFDHRGIRLPARVPIGGIIIPQ